MYSIIYILSLSSVFIFNSVNSSGLRGYTFKTTNDLQLKTEETLLNNTIYETDVTDGVLEVSQVCLPNEKKRNLRGYNHSV
jgi:hypothetical protein